MKRSNEAYPRRSSKSPGHEGDFRIVTAFTIIANRFHSFCDTDWFEAQDWPGLRNWLNAIVNSALFDSVMHKYPPWQSGAEAVVFAPDLANLKV
jgi:hypothetical protein